MYKKILFNDKARTKILEWVNITADAVLATLWPRWTHVIFEDWIIPTITKDWVTVAQQILLKDKFVNMWVMLTKEAAETTNREAWDGTTSTVAILQSIVNEGNKYVVSWMNPVLIKKGIDKAVESVIIELEKITRKLKTKEDKVNIATISANNDRELWEMIVDVIESVWTDWVVTVTTHNSWTTDVEYVTGTKIDSWFASQIFINDSKRLITSLKNPTILVTSDRVTQQSQIIPVLQKLLAEDKREIVLFAEDIDWQALAFLMQNYIQGKFMCVPVKLPSFWWYQKDIMRDFSKLIQATVVWTWEGRKLEEAQISDAWTCEEIIIARDHSILVGGKWDVTSNVEEVKALLEWEKDSFRVEKLKQRLGKLVGKIANIKVWGSSQTEQTEIKYRIEDALNATKSAIKDWIVEWAWTALLRCSQSTPKNTGTKEFNAWFEIVMKAIQSPFKKIILNWGENADAILWKVIESENGYNSLTQEYENLFESWIIDPKMVVQNELINAASTASILLTSSVAIVNEIEEK